jgi:hypothetical protein
LGVCIEFAEISFDPDGPSEDGLRVCEFRTFKFNLLSIDPAALNLA